MSCGSIQGNLVPKLYQEMLRKIKIERMANFIIFTKSVIVGSGNLEKRFTTKTQSYASFEVWFQHTEAI
jgi:hypothetical protein